MMTFQRKIAIVIFMFLGCCSLLDGCTRPPPEQSPANRDADLEQLTAEWAYQQGLQALNRDAAEDAIRYFQLAITRDVMHLRAYLSLGDVYSMQQNYPVAETYYNKVLKYDPESIPALTALGTIQWKMGNHRDALNIYHEVLKRDPANEFARQQAESVTQDLFAAYYEQGVAYKDAGEIEAALTEFQKAQSLAPDNLELTLEIGNMFLEQQDYVMADRYFQQALSQDSSNLPAIIGAGKVQQALKHYAEALKYFQQGFALEPENQDVKNLLKQTQTERVQKSLPSQYRNIASNAEVTRGELAAMLSIELMIENRLPAAARPTIISDITTYWAKPYIIKAVQLGIMGLPPDRFFRPDEPIQKGELAFVIDSLFRKLNSPLPDAGSEHFADVSSENEYHDAIQRVSAAGLMSGVTDKNFGIMQPVSGEYLLQILAAVREQLQ